MSSTLHIWLNIVGMLIALLSISAGLVWLERSAARVVFPDLWAARTTV